jgi:RNase P/RNase MRP subunit p29
VIDLMGRKVAIVQCSDPSKVGMRGLFALETMKTVTILSNGSAKTVPKVGTVFQLQDNGKVIVGEETLGRLEDRIARGAKV